MEQKMIEQQIISALGSLAKTAQLKKGAQIVVGCSTSEITGGNIGQNSAPLVGEWVAKAVIDFCKEQGYIPVFQCCEHLNRSLVIEQEVAIACGYTQVNALPMPKAGGSVPSAAYKMMEAPTLVSHVQAQAGMDIGNTLIGMHLMPVAVPYRCEIKQVGHAQVVLAYSRLPYVGGSRAVYA